MVKFTQSYKHEAISVASLLLIGGLEKAASMWGHIMYFVAGSPSHGAELLGSTGVVRNAVKEFLRRFARDT